MSWCGVHLVCLSCFVFFRAHFLRYRFWISISLPRWEISTGFMVPQFDWQKRIIHFVLNICRKLVLVWNSLARTGRRRDWPLLHVAYVAFTRSLCWCALLTCIDWQACEDIQTASRAALASFTVSIVEIVWFTKLSQKQPGKAFWKSAVLSRLSRPAWAFKGRCQ